MITIQDTLLNTQSPLLLQLDIAPDRTLLLVCEFLRLLPERLEEGSSQQNFDDSSTNPGSAEIAQVVQRDDSKEGIEDIVWVMKLYERLHTEVILRERAASVRELPAPVLRALAQACSPASPVILEKLEVRFFFMGRQPHSEVQVKLVNHTLCIAIKEDVHGALKDFVTNRVLPQARHARDMMRYSQERSRRLEDYQKSNRARKPEDLVSRFEKRLKAVEDTIAEMSYKAKGRPAKRGKLFETNSDLDDSGDAVTSDELGAEGGGPESSPNVTNGRISAAGSCSNHPTLLHN